MSTVSFRTFGCKLNQAETDGLVQKFRDHGYRIVAEGQKSDVSVINTCTVTARSDAKCRQAIRRIIDNSPSATIVIVGCYSQVAAEEVASIRGVDYVFGVEEKWHFFNHFPGPGKRSETRIRISGKERSGGLEADFAPPLDRTRAFLKIQDGCNHACAYCIVPLARGLGRSVRLDKVVEKAVRLFASGVREIVLTGVHIGDYGKETGGRSLLPDLLEKLVSETNEGRIRLSSLDAEDVNDGLLDIVEKHARICRHFHIPVQSGSDAVLGRMNRTTTSEKVRSAVGRIFERFPEAGLGADFIVGFLGETDAEFSETVRMVEELPFAYLHVFPFSPRPGTVAALLPDPLLPRIRFERARILKKLGEEKKKLFVESRTGRTLDVLLEAENRGGSMGGFSSEYLRVEVPWDPGQINRLVKVLVESVRKDRARGKVVE